MQSTAIEWTDATWNPVRGCSRVSEGCRNCYAERVAHRFSGPGQPYEGLTQIVNGRAAWTGKVQLVEKHLLDPLGWKPVWEEFGSLTDGGRACKQQRPRRIFVNSMSDLFHENVPDEWIAKIVAITIRAHWHVYQVLTKRPGRMRALLFSVDFWRLVNAQIQADLGGVASWKGLPDNVHLGVSVEDQKSADERVPLLLQTPAAVRFLSAEPLLAAIDLTRISQGANCWVDVLNAKWFSYHAIGGKLTRPSYFGKLDWVIAGGESGPGARPMHLEWARSLRDQCIGADVPFFFKQWGEWSPTPVPGPAWMERARRPENWREWPDLSWSHRKGKKAAGALLDGREWKEFPLGGIAREALSEDKEFPKCPKEMQ